VSQRLRSNRYDYLDDQRDQLQTTRAETENATFEDILRARLRAFGLAATGNLDWIYKNDIAQVWKDYIEAQKEIN